MHTRTQIILITEMRCLQVLALADYRAQLSDYLKSRMAAIAPNLTVMVGELVGARLISHAGSLMNLAKHPASTVQILGAEKALFRALKSKHETPKYGLIYHASLIGQSAPKFKGKISRVLAAKSALAIRVDALGDSTDATVGLENRAKVLFVVLLLDAFEMPSWLQKQVSVTWSGVNHLRDVGLLHLPSIREPKLDPFCKISAAF